MTVQGDPFRKAFSAESQTVCYSIGEATRQIQVMRYLEGLPEKEVLKRALTVEIDGVVVKVLDPIALCQAKAANLVKIAQEGRQDLRHLRISITTTSHFLGEILRRHGSRPAINAINRVIAISLSPNGRYVRENYQINWLASLPWPQLAEMRSTDNAIANFCEKQVPRWALRLR